MRNYVRFTIASICVIACACGDDGEPANDEGQTQAGAAASRPDVAGTGASGRGGAGAGGAGGAGAGSADTECVAALKLDTCCREYVPATRESVDSDQCLVSVLEDPETALREACLPDRAQACAGMQCPANVLPSAVAVSDGGSGCRFEHECASAADCVIARHHQGCCSHCTMVVPRALIEQNMCLVPDGEETPAACPDCESPIECPTCGMIEGTFCEPVAGGLRRCASHR